MPKTFTYEEEGLAYTVTLYEDPDNPGSYLADISVEEGAMDVNAIYYGDDDFTGDSESLGGPLNMNGARLEGENIQWDAAVGLSDPGLGPEGEDKDTYISSGDTLTVELDISSLDEVDVFGIRATSTTTEEGSIKAVSDDPEEPEDPEDPVFDKVGFGIQIGENGGIENGVFIAEENLPEDQEGTFENYVNFYDSQFSEDPDYNITQVESVIFYDLTIDENGLEIPTELFRIDAPEGGFADADALLAAYDNAVADGALDGATTDEDGAMQLMAALSLEEEPSDPSAVEDPEEEDLFEFA